MANTDAPIYPQDRFEWERMIRRADLQTTTKLVALTLATYGNKSGKSIRPGNDRLMRVCRIDGDKTIRRHLQFLRDGCWIRRTSNHAQSARRALADEYELTYPTNVLDLPGLLDPDELPVDNVIHNLWITDPKEAS